MSIEISPQPFLMILSQLSYSDIQFLDKDKANVMYLTWNVVPTKRTEGDLV